MIKEPNKRSLAFSLFRSSGPFLWTLSIVLYILGTQVSYVTPLVLEQYSNDLDAGLIGMRLYTSIICLSLYRPYEVLEVLYLTSSITINYCSSLCK